MVYSLVICFCPLYSSQCEHRLTLAPPGDQVAITDSECKEGGRTQPSSRIEINGIVIQWNPFIGTTVGTDRTGPIIGVVLLEGLKSH